MNRRKFNQKLGTGAVLTIGWPFIGSCSSKNGRRDSRAATLSQDFDPDLDLELTAEEQTISILPGQKTRVWTFDSQLISGNQDSLQKMEDSYLGPIIKVRRGQKIRIRFRNQLPEETIVHWHGMHVPEQYDGHPKDVINTGESYIYEFEVMNRAGTYWFHPHPDGRTGPQVYYGLTGLFLVTDEEEQNLILPTGEFDIPVIIQDRTFDQENQLIYLTRGHMDRMTGFLGNQILVNGQPSKVLSLKSDCVYRLRLLNGSNSRIYKLGWSDGRPLTAIGVDGSLLPAPKELPYIMLGPAERVDLWVDLRNMSEGTELTMNSLSFPSMGMMGGRGMMGRTGMMGGDSSALPEGSHYPIFNIHINGTGSTHLPLPDKLADFQPNTATSAHNRNNPRVFTFAMQGMEWTINGRTWETNGVAEEEKVKLGSTEVWELINSGTSGRGGMMGGRGMMGNMMRMAHPIHLHQVQFNILSRNIDGVDPELWDVVKDGFIDEGWQDTILLLPGMRAKIIMIFKNYTGLFLYHCHNLEHEDMGMMRNFEIVAD